MPRPLDPSRRSDILRAARDVFLEHGYTGARMAEIAARTGIATGTLYLSFPSKEALAKALTEDFYVRLTAAIMPSLVCADGAAAIDEVVRTAIAFAADERDLIRMLKLDLSLVNHGPAKFPGARVQLHDVLARTLEDGMNQGALHRYDPLVVAELITGLIEWIVEVCLLRGSGNLACYEDTLICMLQHALLHASEEANT
jgi:AcrR family transcriptional regulator